jgi:four helix bundle protein
VKAWFWQAGGLWINSAMKNYRELKIWQRSHIFTVLLYQVTKKFPRDEVFALTSQMRRASVSIPANIAEGCGREGDAELKRFLTIALGSACEVDYYVLLAWELGYLDDSSRQSLAAEIMEIRRMLGTFVQKLKA